MKIFRVNLTPRELNLYKVFYICPCALPLDFSAACPNSTIEIVNIGVEYISHKNSMRTTLAVFINFEHTAQLFLVFLKRRSGVFVVNFEHILHLFYC